MKQRITNKKLNPLQGFLMVLGLVVAVLLLNALAVNVLARLMAPRIAAIIFYLLCILLVLWVFRFVQAFVYEIQDNCLRLARSYGKRERHIEDIYFTRMLFLGTVKEAEGKYPGIKRLRAFCKGCRLPVMALVYENSLGRRMALIQPDEQMLNELKKQLKK